MCVLKPAQNISFISLAGPENTSERPVNNTYSHSDTWDLFFMQLFIFLFWVGWNVDAPKKLAWFTWHPCCFFARYFFPPVSSRDEYIMRCVSALVKDFLSDSNSTHHHMINTVEWLHCFFSYECLVGLIFNLFCPQFPKSCCIWKMINKCMHIPRAVFNKLNVY